MVNAEQVEEQTKNVKFAVEETKEVRAITQKPKFVNNNENAKISNAQKGTLMHLCVQKMNEKEEYTAEKIQELIDELKQREIISKTEAESINIGKLQGYTKSDLWQELKNAKEIHKEKAFYINVKASRMYDISKENDENILVQGIIDLYYIDKDGKLVLVDYKTDYVEEGKEINNSNIEYAGDLSKGGTYDGTTEEKAYRINCIEDLVEWSNNYSKYNSSYMELEKTLNFESIESYSDCTAITTDINGNGQLEPLIQELTTGAGFKPIASFNGSFDGKNLKILNIYIEKNESAGFILSKTRKY